MDEIIHDDYAGFVEASTVDTVVQCELWKATWSSLTDVNFYRLDWCLKRHSELLDRFVPATFVSNHDVAHVAGKVGTGRAALTVVLLMTVGSMPNVYYGGKQAFRGVKIEALGGNNEVRPILSATPSGLAPQGAWMLRLHQDLIGLWRRHPWLMHAHTEVTELDNPRLSYDAVGEKGQRLHVSLALEPAPRAGVHAPGEEPLVVEPPAE